MIPKRPSTPTLFGVAEMADARPTPAEKADAAHRLADALDEVHAALNKCGEILRERQPAGSYSTYPLFWDGDKIKAALQKAREALWDASHPVSHQGFTEGRAAARIDGCQGSAKPDQSDGSDGDG